MSVLTITTGSSFVKRNLIPYTKQSNENICDDASRNKLPTSRRQSKVLWEQNYKLVYATVDNL